MANLTSLALLLFVAVAAATANASSHTTVVTTTTVMEEGLNTRESCESEMKQKMPMHKCMMWMESKMRRGPYNGGDDAFLRSAVANPRYQEEEHLEECCKEIKRFSSPCQCDAIEAMMMTTEREEMERAVCSLPSKCRISGCGHCGSFAA